MKSALSFIQIIILALCAQTVNAVGPGQSMQILQPSINVPTTKFFDGSKRITLNAFRGHFVIVNFWASWCPPCINEMPSLDRLAEKLAKDNFMVIAISQDEGAIKQGDCQINGSHFLNIAPFEPLMGIIMAAI